MGRFFWDTVYSQSFFCESLSSSQCYPCETKRWCAVQFVNGIRVELSELSGGARAWNGAEHQTPCDITEISEGSTSLASLTGIHVVDHVWLRQQPWSSFLLLTCWHHIAFSAYCCVSLLLHRPVLHSHMCPLITKTICEPGNFLMLRQHCQSTECTACPRKNGPP